MNSKHFLTFLLLACLTPLFAGWENALEPEGKGITIKLADFKSIVTSANPDARESYAAALLAEIMEKVTGSKLAVSSGEAGGKTFRFAADDPALGDEGYRIEVRKGDIVLTGGKRRGVINAVLALLEEDLGVRWYAAGEPPRIPSTGANVKIVPRSYVPALLMREPFYHDAFNADWEVLNRTNQTWLTRVPEKLGGSWNFPRQAFCHTFNNFLPPELFDTHPEYFPLINGKRTKYVIGSVAAHICFSHPDVVDVVAGNAIKFLKSQKTPCELLSISQNDGGNGFCQCQDCTAFAKREGSVSGPLVDFVNKVAAKVAVEFPDIKVETLAYIESFHPPKTIRPAKNVMIRLCTDTHAWKYPHFFIEESRKFREAQKAWHAIGANILIWDYVVDYHNYPMLNPNLWVMDHNLDTHLKHGAKGIMLQGAYQSPGGADSKLKSWIFAKRLWNPAWELDDLLEDFIEGYYGPAADAMEDYVELQKDEWEKFHRQYAGKELEKLQPTFKWSHEALGKIAGILERAKAAAKDDALVSKRLLDPEFSYLYTRLSAGPSNADDIASFRRDLARYNELVKKLKVTHHRENGTSTQMQDIANSFECGIADELFRQIPAGGFRFCAHNITRIWPAGEQTAFRLKEDDRTILGQKGGKGAWSMQWRFDSGNYAPGVSETKFVPGQKYRLRVKCRVDATGNDTPYFSVAVWDYDKNRSFGNVTAHGSDFTGKEWVMLEGTSSFEPTANQVLYVTPAQGTDLQKLYIDHIQLVPVNEADVKELAAMGALREKKKEVNGILKKIPASFLDELPEGGFIFCSYNIPKIWPTGEQTAFRHQEGDITVLGQKGGKGSWSMQWPLNKEFYSPAGLDGKFVPGQQYRLRVKCRVETDSADGQLFYLAVWDPEKKSGMGRINVSAADVNSGEWVTIEGSAAFEPTTKQLLYVSPTTNPALKTLYIEYIQLVPADVN